MRAVFGIGNPGSRYADTRHNAGFIILDSFAEKKSLEFRYKTENYYYCRGELNSSVFVLAKPVTYVNLSGVAAFDIINEYNILPEDFLVVYDDINLETGRIRLRKSGGDGGHNGMNSIIQHLKTDNFPRLRFGIGNNFKDGEMPDYVLGAFEKSEKEKVEESLKYTDLIIEEFINSGYQSAINVYSRMMSKNKPDSEKFRNT